MIFGNINAKEDFSMYLESIQKALQYLKENNIATLEAGVYEIDGKNIYAQVIDATTSNRSEKRPEVHRTYIDVQFLATGEENIGFYPDMGDNEIDEELLAEKDIIFYKNNPKAGEGTLAMKPGCYAIFFPTDVHIPAISSNNSMSIRKAVIKVKVDTM